MKKSNGFERTRSKAAVKIIYKLTICEENATRNIFVMFCKTHFAACEREILYKLADLYRNTASLEGGGAFLQCYVYAEQQKMKSAGQGCETKKGERGRGEGGRGERSVISESENHSGLSPLSL